MQTEQDENQGPSKRIATIVLGVPLLLVLAFVAAPCTVARARTIVAWTQQPMKMRTVLPTCENVGGRCNCRWDPKDRCEPTYTSSGGAAMGAAQMSDCDGNWDIKTRTQF